MSQRANIEIAKAGEKSTKASASAKVRWNKGKDANALQTQSDGNATQDTGHKTQDIKHKKTVAIATPPDGVSPEVWADFVKHRKTRRALITPLVMQGIQREADKAGWSLEDALREVVVRNWQSFKSEWVPANSSPSTTRFSGDV